MENLLYSLNPWWEWKNWEEKDRDLKAFRNMKVRWEPSWIKEISLTPF
ncbi:MAG: ATP-binding protein, partial [Thermoprotei archaeon]